jgi:hypothetical protein
MQEPATSCYDPVPSGTHNEFLAVISGFSSQFLAVIYGSNAPISDPHSIEI